jgi:glycosyltransferase involved in cell wall biosynthesis
VIPAVSKASIVNSICVQHDAISNSVAEDASALESVCPGGVTLFSYHCDLPGLRAKNVSRVGELLADPHFLASDLLLFHFGIHYDLFDALLLGNGRARRFARFHNVTPRELVPPESWPTIDRSLAQLENLAWADHVWCDSEFNRRFLVDFGMAPERLSTLELPVDVPVQPPARSGGQSAGPVVFLYFGRVVPAKGVHDLVRAAIALRERGVGGFRVVIAGNEGFSDAPFVGELHRQVDESGARDFVTFCGEVSEAEKSRLMSSAHALVMPSYHEGFCMPVVEALGHGCCILGYAAGNTPFIANGFGTMVPPGDVDGLARAMAHFALSMREAEDPWVDTDGQGRLRLSEFRARAHGYARHFAPDRIRDRFLADLERRMSH